MVDSTFPPTVMVIFGATGDLTHRKLMPALYTLYERHVIDKHFHIIGFARRPYTHQDFRTEMKAAVQEHNPDVQDPLWEEFSSLISYCQGNFDALEAYTKIKAKLDMIREKNHGTCHTIFYLATPPQYYENILDNIEKSSLAVSCTNENGWTKILIEKPFGKDLMSARALDAKLSTIFDERQIYRIDHYLGKETVQNILAFRFANGIFDPIWNNNYVDHIQITMSETKGVGGRGMFFDGNGTLRDVMQNHMLAMAALTGMEQPRNFSAEEVRNARCAFIKSLQDISSNTITHDIIRGQYVGGVVQGEAVVGYKQEKDIETTSDTETFVAMRLYVNTPRWKGVPWYLRAGKRLRKNAVEISIVFRQTCHILFKEYGCPEEGNILTIRVAPDEGIGIRFIAKAPASRFSLKAVDMDFAYAEAFNATDTMDAYEHILIDAFNGDQMIFNRTDELEESWEYITTILRAWEMQKVIPVPYASGSWGPQAAIDLIEKDGREWIIK